MFKQGYRAASSQGVYQGVLYSEVGASWKTYFLYIHHQRQFADKINGWEK